MFEIDPFAAAKDSCVSLNENVSKLSDDGDTLSEDKEM